MLSSSRLGGFWARTAFTTHSRKCTHLSPCTGCLVSRATNRKHILCSECRLHTQTHTHTHSTGCAPNPSWRAQGELVRPKLSCWMFHRSFHLISSSVKTGIPKIERLRPAGEADLWGKRVEPPQRMSDSCEVKTNRSVTQTLSRKRS